MCCKKIVEGLLLWILLCPFFAYADGSKDLYPAGVRGNRACLFSSQEALVDDDPSFPFRTTGAHYVFLKEGETLAVASSATGLLNGRIRVSSPLKTYTASSSAAGLIAANGIYNNRQAELAGPRIGYKPYEIQVAAGETGIWKIEFQSPTSTSGQAEAVLADDNWSQTLNHFIAAWDISVRNAEDTEWIPGRVFANILNLQLNAGQLSNANGSYYGANYVLTNDGYLYYVNGNGSNGIAFSYWVNNRGLLNPNGNPAYKSINNSRNLYSRGLVHDPRSADTDVDITHKIFYTKPDLGLPAQASGIFPGGNTWLLRHPDEDPLIEKIMIKGAEGDSKLLTKKGAFIYFETNISANYEVTISSKSSIGESGYFPQKSLVVSSVAGLNKVHWDGTDGNGNFLKLGLSEIVINIQRLGGEVHFPYLDMEINPNGIIIERLDPNWQLVVSDVVYWDDSDISISDFPEEMSSPIKNLQGISSRINGHAYGTYSNNTVVNPGGNLNANKGAFSFGNEKAMDTWTYVKNVNVSVTDTVEIRIADLKIASITANQDSIELLQPVTYHVVVSNDGPSTANGATITWNAPKGMQLQKVTHSSGCGEVVAVRQIPDSYQAVVNLPDSCSISFDVILIPLTSQDYGNIHFTASVMRPEGIIDPDATNIDPNALLTDAETECEQNGLGGNCNNILTNSDVFLWEPINERGKISLRKTVQLIDQNGDGYSQSGELLRYQFYVKNTGLVALHDLQITDPKLSLANGLYVKELLPGEEKMLMADYSISDKDFSAGQVKNSALVRALNPRNFPVKDISGTTYFNDDSTVFRILYLPDLRLIKSVSNSGNGKNGLFISGDSVVYQFVVANKGIPAILSVSVADALLGNQSVGTLDSLISNQQHSFYGIYVLQDADFDLGYVDNVAYAHGIGGQIFKPVKDQSGATFESNEILRTPVAKRGEGVIDSVSLKQNQKMDIAVLRNDRRGSGEFLSNTISISTAPSHGQIISQASGMITYLPDVNYSGSDDFYYTVMDDSKLTIKPTRVIISVLKTIPVANDDQFTLRFNTSLLMDVLANDVAELHTVLNAQTIQVLSNPLYGVVVVREDKLMYYPNDKFTGKDQLSYKVQDSNGNWTNEAFVTVQVEGFLIPNVFTPNGDGKNDYFELVGKDHDHRFAIKIFTRSGVLVYSSEDYQNNWDGNGLADQTFYVEVTLFENGRKLTTKRSTLLKTKDIKIY